MNAPDMRPPKDCAACPRLEVMRAGNRAALPGGWNAPVPSFGPLGARVLVVGLAPGLRGANFTGRPFTGDGAGDVLYPALARNGLARGTYGARANDGLEMAGCRITNAVRCVPPGNKPTGAEIRACGGFLRAEIAAMGSLKVIVALGRVAHESVLRALSRRPAAHPFTHGSAHDLDGVVLVSSYHCSRYNMNTRRLTEAMLDDVLARAQAIRHV